MDAKVDNFRKTRCVFTTLFSYVDCAELFALEEIANKFDFSHVFGNVATKAAKLLAPGIKNE